MSLFVRGNRHFIITMFNFAIRLKRLFAPPIYSSDHDEDQRRIQMIFSLTWFHLILICLAGLRFLLAGMLPSPLVVQFIINLIILVLIYVRRIRAAVMFLVLTYVLSNFVMIIFSDMTSLLYVLTTFVAVSVLLERRVRRYYTLLTVAAVLLAGYLTADMPQYASVTHENVVLFVALGVISTVISTRVIQGDREQIKAQLKALQEKDTLYRLLVQNINDMVTLHTPDGRFLYASPSYIKSTGFSEAELLAMSQQDLATLVHPDDLQRTRDEAHQQVLSGQAVTRLTYRRRKKDGTYFWVEAYSTPLYDTNGQLTQLLLSTRDITENKRLESALRTSHEQLRTTLKGSAIVVAQADKDLRYEWIHNAHPDFDATQVLGKRDDELAQNAGTQQLMALKSQVLKEARPIQQEISFPLSTGIIVYNVSAEPIRDALGDIIGVTTVSFDITARKQMENALKKSQAQLTAAQRIAQIGSWHWDTETSTVSWSDEIYRIFGIEPKDFNGDYNEYLKLIHPDDRDYVDKVIKASYRTHKPYALYHRVIHPQRGERIIHGQGQVVTDAHDNMLYMHGTAHDVTEMKQAEQTVSIKNRYLETLYQMTLDLIQRRSIDDLLQRVVDDSAIIMDAPYSEIMLKEGDTLVVRAFTKNLAFIKDDRIQRGEAVLSWQAHDTLEPVVIESYLQLPQRRGTYDRIQLQAVADFPIIIDDVCVGVLGVARAQANYPFTPEQIQIGVMFSRLAALAVDNVHHYNAAMQEIAERKQTEARLQMLLQELETKTQIEIQQRIFVEQLHKTVHILNSTLDLDEILRLILENIGRIIPHSSSSIMLITDDVARVVQYKTDSPQHGEMLMNTRFPIAQVTHLDLMYRTHQSCIINDVASHDGWHQVHLGYTPGSYLGAPICVDEEVLGFLNLICTLPNCFSPADAKKLDAFVHYAAIALKNSRLHARSQELAAYQERQRLARDLHDSVTQTLFAASVTANAVIKQWRREASSVESELLELRDMTQGALAEMRTMLLELRPNALSETSLNDLLAQLVQTVKGRARLHVHFEVSGQHDIPSDVSIAFFRIAQEAINNVIKHARAQNLHIRLMCAGMGVEMCIEDDGCGFDIAQTTHNRFGLKIMQERAQEAQVLLRIASQQAQGTTITTFWQPEETL